MLTLLAPGWIGSAERTRRWRLLRSGLLAILLMLPIGLTGAQPASIEELLARAARDGTVRVIIELRVDDPRPRAGTPSSGCRIS